MKQVLLLIFYGYALVASILLFATGHLGTAFAEVALGVAIYPLWHRSFDR